MPFSPDEIETSVHARFEDIARRCPDRVAMKIGERAFTYDELNRAANRVAHAILARHGEPRVAIAVLLEGGFEQVAAFLGVLKAGQFAVMVAPSFPVERLTRILDDSQARVIVTNTSHLELARTFQNESRTTLNTDDQAALCADDPGLCVSGSDLAALMYTSGSTGTPKAVIRAHRDFLHLSSAYAQKREFTEDDRSSLVHSLCFGSAYSDLLPTLLSGAALLPFDLRAESMHRFAAWLRDEQITVCHLPPLAFRQLASCLTGHNPLPHLRLLCLSGAPVTRIDFDLYTKHLAPTALLEIVMGSTETCSVASAIVDHRFTFPEEGTPIGYPHLGRTILLLDERHREVGPGETGEMAIKGQCITRGYWRRPELTREKFLADPGGGDERTYLSGDLGRRLPNGMFIHVGRKDSLVKIRGYRVEIAEIERALAACHHVHEAAVVAWDGGPGEKYLAAYVVPRPGATLSVQALQDWLRSTLPEYMVPSSVTFVSSLPLTNGKLDRRALPPPDHQRPALRSVYEPARSAVESQLVSLWETLLGTAPIGIRDDFFALGGHSLLGASMMAQVHDICRVDLPLRALFEGPTIAQLATSIEAKRERRAYRQPHIHQSAYLFQLQAGHERTPVFFFPGGGGGEPEFFVYARVARAVGPEYPFYALRARGADGLATPHRSVRTMAADYLAEIQTLQPHGPYVLVGECFGGIAAYEVAGLLQSKGERVAALIMMDTQRPTEGIYWKYRVRHSFGPVGEIIANGRLLFHWKALRNLSPPKWIPYVGRYAVKMAKYLLKRSALPESSQARAEAVLASDPTKRDQRHIVRSRHHYRLALRRHRPRPYTGPVELLVNEHYHQRDPALGWATLARGGLRISKMPGTHDSYIREHVHVTAEALRARLDEAFNRMKFSPDSPAAVRSPNRHRAIDLVGAPSAKHL